MMILQITLLYLFSIAVLLAVWSSLKYDDDENDL